MEIGSDGMQGEGIGTMSVVLLGNADGAGANNAGEAAEGVGKLVGILETAGEELVLGVAGPGGDELEVKGGDGCGDFEGVEMGVKRAQEDLRGEGGFGESEGTGVGRSVVESEMELELGGGALVVAEPVAEGLQETLGHEEERFMVGHRRFEVVLDLVLVGSAVKFEEAVVLLVENVMESGERRAQSLGQSLSRELGKIAQGLKAPKLQDLEVGQWK